VKLTIGLIHLRHNNTYFVRSLATKTPSASSSATRKPEQTGAQQQRTTTAASGTSSSDKTSKLQKNRIN
jgi:hypothetical protein